VTSLGDAALDLVDPMQTYRSTDQLLRRPS
jgi:hypothetical protein